MFTVEPLNSEISKRTETEAIDDFVKVSSNDGSKHFCVLPRKIVDSGCLDRIKKMEVYDDDVWITSYPKCGTTWTQEMLWLVLNDLNYDEANSIDLYLRSPFVEWSGIIKHFGVDYVEMSQTLRRPRLLKSHLPLFLLPDQLWTVKPKIVYIARNPKDVAVSFFHHHRHLHSYKGSKADFVSAFVSDELPYSPINEHVLEFWKIRHEPNVLFLFYEDMKEDLDREVKKAIQLLGKNFSQPQIDQLCTHLSFDSMRKNERINKEREIMHLKQSTGKKYVENEFHFIRKGKVGSYKEELSAEENEKLDAYAQHPEFGNFDFSYRF